jgi:phage-related protein
MAERTLGARITLADRLSNGMMRVIQTLTRTQAVAERMNQTTQRTGQTMQSAANQAANGMSRMGNATNSAANGASKMAKEANEAANAAERVGNAAERAAQKWGMLGEKYGTSSTQTTMMMSNLDNASLALQATGTAATAAGAGIAYGFGNAINKAAEFEAQMSSIKSLGVVGQDFDKLKQLAIDAGASTKYSSLEAAKGIEELQRAGVAVTDIINGGLYGALNLATAGDLELAEAAEIASTALNAFRADKLSVAQAGDILAGAANASATSVHELRYGLAASSAVASGVGLKFKDTATALAAFAQNGLKGSDAGTSLKTMLLNLTPKTKDQFEAFERLNLVSIRTQKAMEFLSKNGIKPASNSLTDIENALRSYAATEAGAKLGTEKANKAYREMGLALGWLGSEFYDQNGKIKSMAEIAGILQRALRGMSDEQRQLTLYTMFGSDAIRAGNILFKEGAEGINKMQQEMSKVTAAEVAAEKLNNLKGAVEQLNGAIETAKISIGNMFLPALTVLAKGAGILVNAFNSLPGPIQAMLVTIAALAGVFLLISGPLLLIISLLPSFIAGMEVITGVLGMTSGAIMALVGKFILVTSVIAGIALAFAFLYSKSEILRNAITNGWNQIKTAIITAVAPIKPALAQLQGAFWSMIYAFTGGASTSGQVWKRLGDKVGQFVNWFMSQAVPLISAAFKNFSAVAVTAINIAIEAFNMISRVWQVIGPVVIAIVGGIFNNIKAIISSGIGIIMNVMNIFRALFTGDWSLLWENVKSLLMNALTFAWNLVQITFLGRLLGPIRAGMGLIRGLISVGWNFIKGIFTGTLSTITGLVRLNMGGIGITIRAAMTAIRTAISIALNTIKGIWKVALSILKGDFSGAWKIIKSTVTTNLSSIGKLMDKGMNALSDAGFRGLTKVKQWFSTKWDEITGFMKNLPDKFTTYGKNVIDGLWNGIKNAAVGLGDKMKKLIDENIPKPVKDLLGIASPSKLFTQYGAWTMQGLENGINTGASGVMGSVKRVASDLANTSFTSNISLSELHQKGNSVLATDEAKEYSRKPTFKPSRIGSSSSSSGVNNYYKVNIEITGDQVAAMSKDEAKFKETAEKLFEYFVDRIEQVKGNHTIDNLEMMMD